MRFRTAARSFALAFATTTALVSTVGAVASSWYLRLEGVDGEVKQKGHEKAMEVLSWSWGVAPSAAASGATLRTKTRGCLQDLVIFKPVDKASPSLLTNALLGTQIASGRLVGVHDGELPFEFLSIDLSKVQVVSVGQSASGDGGYESIQLRPLNATVTYKPQDDKGGTGPAATAVLSGPC